MTDALTELRDRLRAFARERDWERHHTPKNLTAAVVGEAGELVSVLQWYVPGEELAPYTPALEEDR